MGCPGIVGDGSPADVKLVIKPCGNSGKLFPGINEGVVKYGSTL